MENSKGKFGLFTTIAMICGVVIGSGIFFKSDDILIATGGNVALGILLWVLGAFGMVFGGLCIAQFAKKTSEAGGLITYCELAWGKSFAYLAGWFQTVFYFPAIIAVLSWIASLYIGLVFGIEDSSSLPIWIIMMVILFVTFTLNIMNTRNAGKFQDITLIIKLLALGGLSLVGLIFGSVSNISTTTTVSNYSSGGLFAGLVACAFSYDGWFVGPTIAHEIRDPKKNLSKALVISPMIILSVYLFYFIGINAMLGPEMIMHLGDSSVGYIVQGFFGDFAVKVVYIAVIISILGTINGLTLGYIRLPYSLALRDEFPRSERFKKVDGKYGISLSSALFCFVMVLVWSILHFLSVKDIVLGFIHFGGLQIDSLPIVLTYVFYGSLYISIIIKREGNLWESLICPLLALLGASLVLLGGLSDPNGLIYFVISFIGIAAGLLIRPKRKVSA